MVGVHASSKKLLSTKKQIPNKSSLKERAQSNHQYYFETDNRKNESDQLRNKSLNLLEKEREHNDGDERIIDLRMCNS